MSQSTLLQDYLEPQEPQSESKRRRARVTTTTTAAPLPVESLTLEELALAIAHRIDLPEEDALRDANFIMDIFGFDERVIDNVLEREDRQLFYMLEETGMLTTAREETLIWDGREWRTHYWVLKTRAVKRYAEAQREMERRRREPTEEDLYNTLPRAAWSERRF